MLRRLALSLLALLSLTGLARAADPTPVAQAMKLLGPGVTVERGAEARKLLQAASDSGDAAASALLGHLLFTGGGYTPIDTELGSKLFQQAATAGYLPAKLAVAARSVAPGADPKPAAEAAAALFPELDKPPFDTDALAVFYRARCYDNGFAVAPPNSATPPL